jgi:hypothetical protein
MRTLRACPMLLHGRHASWSSPGGTRSFGFTGPPKENRRGASFDGDPNRKNGSASAETCFGRRTGRASARRESNREDCQPRLTRFPAGKYRPASADTDFPDRWTDKASAGCGTPNGERQGLRPKPGSGRAARASARTALRRPEPASAGERLSKGEMRRLRPRHLSSGELNGLRSRRGSTENC